MSGSMQDQKQPAAHHVTQLAIGLNPIPSLAHLDRELAPTQARTARDQLTHIKHVGMTNWPTTKTQQHIGHAPQFKQSRLER